MFCTYCGKELAEDSKFCMHCGANLGEPAGEQEVECSVVRKLSKRGDLFCLKLGKNALFTVSFGFAGMLVLGALVALSLPVVLLKVSSGDSLITGLSIFMVLVGFIFAVFAVPVTKQALSYARLPFRDDGLYFSKENIRELIVYRKWFGIYQFALILELDRGAVKLILPVKPPDSKEQAEKMAGELVRFFGVNVPIRWTRFSWQELKREFRGK